MDNKTKGIIIGTIIGMFIVIIFSLLTKKELPAYTINTKSACEEHGYYWHCKPTYRDNKQLESFIKNGQKITECACLPSKPEELEGYMNFGY